MIFFLVFPLGVYGRTVMRGVGSIVGQCGEGAQAPPRCSSSLGGPRPGTQGEDSVERGARAGYTGEGLVVLVLSLVLPVILLVP